MATDSNSPDAHRASDSPKLEVTPPKYLSGDVIADKYRLTSLIGEGGMGTVWLARNQTLDADVCVKLIRREVATPQASQRLLQEARAAARLNHPSIVRVFDFGETEYRDPFIVMELLRGDSLRRLMSRKSRVPAANAVATLLPVASALAEAHSKGVIHRDLKPENIVLVSDESGAVIPKIVDFGVAKTRLDEQSRRLTLDGSVLGSPDYMSPEQAKGEMDVDHRIDVWAFSVMLYEMLTGQLPFRGDNYNALLWAIQRAEPEPTTQFAGGDDALWQIIERGLAKSPEGRWDGMRSLGVALAEWAVTHGVDVDVTGNSIALGWLAGSRRPLSEAPATALRAPSFADIESDGRLSGLTNLREVRTESVEVRRPHRHALALAGVAIVVVVALGVLLVGRHRGAPEEAARTPSASTPLPADRPAPTSAAAAPPSSAVLDAGSASPSAAPTRARAPTAECVEPLFPDGTLADPSAARFEFLCTETDPRAGAQQLKGELVKQRGKGVSGGMQEWAKLSWYEMAAFAIVRTHCCAAPQKLSLPSTAGVCEPLDEALDALGRATLSGGDANAAVARVDEAILCLFRKGGAARYPYSLVQLQGPRSTLDQMLKRTRLVASP